jgi:hypothetical protein
MPNWHTNYEKIEYNEMRQKNKRYYLVGMAYFNYHINNYKYI